MNAILQAAERAATARSASLVLHWFDLGHALLVEQMHSLGVAVPARFMAGERPSDEAFAEEAEAEVEDVVDEDDGKPEPWTECGTCGGSGGGEGYWRCQECGGRGTVRNQSWWDDRAAAEADHLYDQAKDERAERGER